MVQTTPAADKSQGLPTVATRHPSKQSWGEEAEASVGYPVGVQGCQEAHPVHFKGVALI